MDSNMAHIAFRILGGLWKHILSPILLFTGLIWPTLLSLIDEDMSFFSGFDVGLFWWILAWLLMAYTFIQNIIRKVKHDPSFKLYKLIIGATASYSEKKLTDPPAPKEMQFDEPQGFVFGKKNGKWICKKVKEDGHIAIAGGPGSGKTQVTCLPSLVAWDKDQPIFAIDIKGELSQKTAKKRKKCKVFSLRAEDFGYNPFYCIDENRNIVKQIREIAIALCPVPAGEKDPYWKQSAQNFITGVLIWGYHSKISFAETMKLMKKTPPDEMAEMICTGDDEEAILFMNQFRNLAEDTLSGVYSEVSNTALVFATDHALIDTLNKPREKCILPSDLDEGYSLYIQIAEHELEQLRNFLTLLVNQFLKHFEQRSEENCNRVLFLLDEFPRLGKLEVMINGLATLRSKGITIALVFQSFAQLDVIYGKDQRKAICDNCGYWAILRIADGETQKTLADNIGTYDRTKKSFSDNKGDFKALGTSGTSVTTEEKRIVKPEDLGRLQDHLILLHPSGFVKVEKQYFWNTPEFKD